MDERRFQFSLAAHAETLHLDLLGEVYIVMRQSFENRLFGAPVHGQLLVPAVVVQVLDFLLGKGLLFYCGEIAVQRLDVDAHILGVVQDHRHVFLGMRDADIGYQVLQIGFAIIVVAQIDLLVEQLVQQGPHRQPLLAQGLALDERDFFHLVRGR